MAKIGIDLDDVLFDTFGPLMRYHNTRYGTAYSRDDIRSWYLERLWDCTRDEAVRRVMEWLDSPHHEELVPLSGAQEAVVMLAEEHELRIISARPLRMRERTLELVRRHFWGSFVDLHLTDHFGERNRSKGEVCRELGIECLVEDSTNHALEAAGAGVHVLLMDSPWNREPMAHGITRVHSWSEVAKHLKDLSRAS